MKRSSFKDVCFFIAVPACALLCVIDLYANIDSLYSLYNQGYPDFFFLRLMGKRGYYFFITWIVVFSLLLMAIVYTWLTQRKNSALILAAVSIASYYVCSYSYNYVTDFADES